MTDPRFAKLTTLRNMPPGAYVVGGAVRDILLGRSPKDVDVACRDARHVAARFSREHGGTLVDLGRERFATYRVVIGDAEYDFSDIQGTREEDLARRDATINALALPLPELEPLIDEHSGLDDLRARRVRMIREQNFIDDPLRVLKCVRMAVSLDFDIEHETLEAMKRNARLLDRIAGERIDDELTRIVEHMRVGKGLTLLREIGVDATLFGGALSAQERRNVLRAQDCIVRWTILTSRFGEAQLEDLASRLRWSTERTRQVLAVRRLYDELSAERRTLLLQLHDAGPSTSRRLVELLYIEGEDVMAERLNAVIGNTRDLFTAEPIVSGTDIMRLGGIAPGPRVGEVKRALLAAQLMGEIRTYEQGMELVRRMART